MEKSAFYVSQSIIFQNIGCATPLFINSADADKLFCNIIKQTFLVISWLPSID